MHLINQSNDKRETVLQLDAFHSANLLKNQNENEWNGLLFIMEFNWKFGSFRKVQQKKAGTFCFRGLVLLAPYASPYTTPYQHTPRKKYFIQYEQIWENILLGGWCLSEYNDQLAYVSSYPLLLFQCCGTGMEFTVRELTHKANWLAYLLVIYNKPPTQTFLGLHHNFLPRRNTWRSS